MARTTSKTTDPEHMTLEQLETLNESANVRRGELVAERKRLEELEATGAPVAKDLRRVRRALEDLEDEVDGFSSALHDARMAQAARVRRATRIARLERQVDASEDVLKFQEILQRAVAEYLEPHLNIHGRSGDVPARFAAIARDVRHGGQLNLNGSPLTVPGQVKTELERARRELTQLRAEGAADA